MANGQQLIAKKVDEASSTFLMSYNSIYAS